MVNRCQVRNEMGSLGQTSEPSRGRALCFSGVGSCFDELIEHRQIRLRSTRLQQSRNFLLTAQDRQRVRGSAVVSPCVDVGAVIEQSRDDRRTSSTPNRPVQCSRALLIGLVGVSACFQQELYALTIFTIQHVLQSVGSLDSGAVTE